MPVSLKLARPLPFDRNRPDVIQSRFEYANWVFNTGVVGLCVFRYECGYNIRTARSCGRAAVGERSHRQVCGQRGRNVTIVIPVSPRAGLMHHSAQIGGMTAQRFQDFLVQTHQRLLPNDPVFFFYDNAPAHRNANNPGANSELKPLPASSPFLNIVEQGVSYLNAAIKAHLSRPDQRRSMGDRDGEARRQGLLLREFRKRFLGQLEET